MDANQALDRYFLKMRAGVLELAASFDRVECKENAAGAAGDDRMLKLRKAVELLSDDQGDRAERVQMVFSDPYDPNWRKKFGL